jgi:hypothetical protein
MPAPTGPNNGISIMIDVRHLTAATIEDLEIHAALLRQGDAAAAGRMAAARPVGLRELMDVAGRLDAALPPLAMRPQARAVMRRRLVAEAERRRREHGPSPLARRGLDLGRRTLTVLTRQDALRLVGAGTAVAAALGVALVVRRRHAGRQTRQVALGLG